MLPYSAVIKDHADGTTLTASCTFLFYCTWLSEASMFVEYSELRRAIVYTYY